MKSALDIYQTHLDTVSRMIWERRFDEVVDQMVYPHELLTEETTIRVDSPDVLRDWAAKFRDRLEELGATAYHRVAIAAAFSGTHEDRIDGFHRVYVLDGATYLIDPYTSEARLKKQGETWLGSGVRATLRHARYAVDETLDT